MLFQSIQRRHGKTKRPPGTGSKVTMPAVPNMSVPLLRGWALPAVMLERPHKHGDT